MLKKNNTKNNETHTKNQEENERMKSNNNNNNKKTFRCASWNKELNSLDQWIHWGAIWFEHKVVRNIACETNFAEFPFKHSFFKWIKKMKRKFPYNLFVEVKKKMRETEGTERQTTVHNRSRKEKIARL